MAAHTSTRTNAMTRLVFTGCLAVLTSNAALANAYPITIENCPSAFLLSVPPEFSQAARSEDRALRNHLLDALHANPGRKTRYSDVFLTDWRRSAPFPQILVGALGTLSSVQGRMTDAQWNELKRTLLTSSQTQRDEWMRRGLRQLKPGEQSKVHDLEAAMKRVAEGGKNDVAAFGDSSFTIGGAPFRLLTAAKFIFAKRCLVYVTLSVEASSDRALEQLTSMLEGVNVK